MNKKDFYKTLSLTKRQGFNMCISELYIETAITDTIKLITEHYKDVVSQCIGCKKKQCNLNF